MHEGPRRRDPLLSIVVVVFEMRREAPRTLFTLSAGYQGVPADLYEVIVVDNGSQPPLGEEVVRSVSEEFRYVYLEPGNPSPAHALNQGARLARGEFLAFMIDGARMLSPGVLAYSIRAMRAYENAIVATLGFHLGHRPQPDAVRRGYDQREEDRLLASVDWEKDGYKLFEISTFACSTRDGWFAPSAESNFVVVGREIFDTLGGFEEGFESPGGGFVNLDFFQRACALPGTRLVIVVGEGTFHQHHGGAATGAPEGGLSRVWKAIVRRPERRSMEEEYRQIRGRRFEIERVPCDFIGHVPAAARPALRDSIDALRWEWITTLRLPRRVRTALQELARWTVRRLRRRRSRSEEPRGASGP